VQDKAVRFGSVPSGTKIPTAYTFDGEIPQTPISPLEKKPNVSVLHDIA
jgi:hypothetical protein